MNPQNVHAKWDETKAKIKAKWSKFTEDDIETLKGNLDHITSKIQKTYGHTLDQAEREYGEFKTSLQGVGQDLKGAAEAIGKKAKDATSQLNKSIHGSKNQ